MANISLKDVHKSFGKSEVLKGVTLEVDDEELMVFVGPSGCGKSTLLRIVAGLERPTSGDVRIDGVRVNDVAPSERGVAMVFQSYALYPHMTVAENIGFCLRNHGGRRAETEARVRRAAESLQIEMLLGRYPGELSGGQRQRVAIGRAIVRNPKLYLFDEPLSNLDALLRVQTRIELASLHQRHRVTTIYVTHDQVEAMTLASRIAVMNAGRLEQVGAPLELYERPKNLFVAGFLGSPAMGFVAGELREASAGEALVQVGGNVLRIQADARALALGTPVTLGARPERLRLSRRGTPGALPAQATLVERLGYRTYVYCERAWGGSRSAAEGGPIVIEQASDRETPRIGDAVALEFSPSQTHLFGPDGAALERAAQNDVDGRTP